MKLRPVEMKDYKFLVECYEDWPLTDDGPITPDVVSKWIRYWIHRKGEDCLIGETNRAVGAIIYRRNFFAVYVKNIVVHPTERRKGYANQMVKAIRDRLVSDGVAVAEFEAMDGPIASQIHRGKFQFVESTQGKTGPLVKGRLTMDMEI